MENLIYQPLPQGSYIRLLQLHGLKDIIAPAAGHELPQSTLFCTLKVVSFEFVRAGESHYHALSYCWSGNSSDGWKPTKGQKAVICNGKITKIRENLYDALIQFSLWKPLPCFWADALCINQDDIHERNSQVSMMGDIYRLADEVAVWLGVEKAESWLTELWSCFKWRDEEDRGEHKII
jgi:hypothetical protein